MRRFRLLLVNPPNIEEEKLDAETVPLGLLYIASLLTQEDVCDVELVNLFPVSSWEGVRGILAQRPFDAIGMPCYTRQRKSVIALATVCKSVRPESFVIVGGPHASFLDRLLLERLQAIDYVVRGEGERTMLQLLQCLASSDFSGIADVLGVSYRGGSQVIQNPARLLEEDLDTLPFPRHDQSELTLANQCNALAFHFSELENWRQLPIAPILTSRGCDIGCLFCCNAAFWSRQRYRSPILVFEEMRRISHAFGAKLFDFYDDNFTASRAHVEELCNLLIQGRLGAQWWCSSRADGIDLDLAMLMREAGCFMISYGLESGSQKILDSIGKRLQVSDLLDACGATRRANQFLRLTVSIGNPGEDSGTIGETIDFLRHVQPNQVALYLLKTYPGTPLYAISKARGLVDDGWWFEPQNHGVPYYAGEHEVWELVAYQEQIHHALSPNVSAVSTGDSHNLELTLRW